MPDGTVHAVLETNGVVYIGGRFDYISPVSETGQAFDQASGFAHTDFPKFAGAIKTILDDDGGGWFVGGLFTSVGGFAITNLAHIRADRTVDTTWTPNPDEEVLALATDGQRLFVGGSFATIAGRTRLCLAALDAATGTALDQWQADCTHAYTLNPTVNTLTYAEGRLFVGGLFSFINGIEREQVASLDATTGQPTSWRPNAHTPGQSSSHIDALALADGIVYVAGNFTSLGDFDNFLVRRFIAALDPTKNLTNSILGWDPDADGVVRAIAVTCDTIYVGGSFTRIGGQPRSRIAALDRATGRATPWNPGADGDVLGLALSGNTLYAGGKFTRIGGQPREFLAALDVETGSPKQWRPRADFGVAALTVSGETVVTGGALGPGGRVVKNVAALNARTGKPLDWAPQIGGGSIVNGLLVATVYALAASSTTVYLGGSFTEISGQTRNRLAAVDASTGALTLWAPSVNATVEALALSGTNVYVGGRFSSAGGARTNLAAISAVTGVATGWRPVVNDKIRTVTRQGNAVYVGGRFTAAGTQQHNRLAALDAGTGLAIGAFNPNVEDDQVSALSIQGSRLYFGGGFGRVTALPRRCLAALDLTSNSLIDWNPDVAFSDERTPAVNSIAIAGSSVYIGGTFNRVAGQQRTSLAAVQTSIPATVTPWNPTLDKAVNALAVARDTVFAGGDFQAVGGRYRPNFAVFPAVGAPSITAQPASQLVPVGQTVRLEATVAGQGPLSYQWQTNGVDLPGATSPTLTIPNAQVVHSGEYVLIATNALGLVHSRPAIVTVFQPLAFLTQPQSQTVGPGTTVTLSVAVAGFPPPLYQWRLNGVNIPGAVSPTLTLSNAQPSSGGNYQVVAANLAGATNSEVATLVVTSPALGFADNLSGAALLTAASGTGSGNNTGATREPGEPNHVGAPGGRSRWIKWRSPGTGIATFSTRGSAFDTLLAVYTGASIAGLTPIGADEDRAGFLTSEVSFNATAGVEYLIAVDGFAGATGHIVLSWNLNTSTVPFPRIITQPLSRSVFAGQTATNFVVVNSPTAVSYQWYFGCRPLLGATNASLTLSNVQRAQVGAYRVVVMNASTQVVESVAAALEIGPDPKVFSRDKLEDLFPELLAGGGGEGGEGFVPVSVPGGFILVSLGSIQSQTLDNSGATTQLGELNHCGVLGGASKWLRLRPELDATFLIDTIGSRIDTVLAVYQPTNLLNLASGWVACDNNGAPDGIRSVVRFDARGNTDYLVVVDGVNGAAGIVNVNWKLGRPPFPLSATNSTVVVHPGQPVMLRVTVTNLFGATYQWRRDGQTVIGATNATLLATSGVYTVIVINPFGSLASTFTLSVEAPLLRATLVQSGSVCRVWLPGSDAPRFILESAPQLVGGNWTPLSTIGPSNSIPYLDFPQTPARQFFRGRPVR